MRAGFLQDKEDPVLDDFRFAFPYGAAYDFRNLFISGCLGFLYDCCFIFCFRSSMPFPAKDRKHDYEKSNRHNRKNDSSFHFRASHLRRGTFIAMVPYVDLAEFTRKVSSAFAAVTAVSAVSAVVASPNPMISVVTIPVGSFAVKALEAAGFRVGTITVPTIVNRGVLAFGSIRAGPRTRRLLILIRGGRHESAVMEEGNLMMNEAFGAASTCLLAAIAFCSSHFAHDMAIDLIYLT